MPNYFGEQRFGRNAANVQLARDAFAGKRLKRQSRSLALSAARSYLFNQVLDARVVDGSWNSLLPGDCANLDGSNSVFRVADVDEELAGRCTQLDLHPSGPMWGSGDLMTAGQVEQQERNIVRRHQDLADGLERMARLSRRPLRVAVQKMHWDIGDDCLQLSFALPGGSYATAVLRELAEYADCGASAGAG